MSRDYEPIKSSRDSKTSLRTIITIVAVAFIGGAIAMGWAAARFDLLSSDSVPSAEQDKAGMTSAPGPVERLEKRIQSDGTVSPVPDRAATADADSNIPNSALATKVAALEDRLSRINVQANAASGNAARAEGLLIAFAARRALDKGSPLGYIENQLQLRFGNAQPNAVAAIVEASRDGATLDRLRAGLDDLGPELVAGSESEGMWASIKRGVGDLFVVRREGTPSPAPAQRLERAKRFLESNRVEAALAEVQAMPGRRNANEWIALANSYIEARRALDIIETAAILEPRELRSGDGERVVQPSPLGPQAETAQ